MGLVVNDQLISGAVEMHAMIEYQFMTITNGARKLWKEHGQEVAGLEAHGIGKQLVTRNEVEKLLQQRGLLPPAPAVQAKGRTAKVCSVPKARMTAGRKTPAAPPPLISTSVAQPSPSEQDPLIDDVAMLDGNTIAIEWPQTREGKGTRFRKRVGIVRHRPKQSRQKHENVYLVEFERRDPSRGLRLRKTSWAQVSKRKYQVMSSTTPTKPSRTRWTEEETTALRVRVAAKEMHKSIGVALGRMKGSIHARATLFNPAYAQPTGGARREKSGVTLDLVERAIQTLPANEGILVEVSAAVRQIAEKEALPLNADLEPGQKTQTRWEKRVGTLLSQGKQFEKLAETRLPATGGKYARPGHVYRYLLPDLRPPQPSLAPHYGNVHQPSLGGPTMSKRAKAIKLAGGDRRHGD